MWNIYFQSENYIKRLFRKVLFSSQSLTLYFPSSLPSYYVHPENFYFTYSILQFDHFHLIIRFASFSFEIVSLFTHHNHIFLQQRNSQRSVIIYNLSIWNLYMLWFPKVFNQRTPLSHLLTAKWNTSVFLWQCCKKWSRASIQRLFTAYLIYAKVKILGTQDAQKLQLYRQIFIPNII